jgi:RES domain
MPKPPGPTPEAVLLYRVFPYLESASEATEPGHPLYVHPVGGGGRWDNPELYLVRYLSTSAEGAVGETFGGLWSWSPAMLPYPSLPGARRVLGTFRLDEDTNTLLDLDDATALVARHIRPTEVVRRNRPRTQQIAESIYREAKWAGIAWWSYQRPQWTQIALWAADHLTIDRVEDLAGHPAVTDAAFTLAKSRRGV